MQARLGDCMLSTDVIVGFPAEDEAAFGRTLAALSLIHISEPTRPY